MNNQKLLTVGNTKTSKGEKLGYRTYGIHFAPAFSSGYNTCISASKGCTFACLNTAGRGIQKNVQKARIKKTKFFFEHRAEFFARLVKELNSRIKSAKRNGFIPAFRPNLTSDLPWEKMKCPSTGKTIFELFPNLICYDYTKIPGRYEKYLRGEMPSNYSLTFSRSETSANQALADNYLMQGGNVAFVFRNRLPKIYNGYHVIDGDLHDLRFTDRKNCIVGLVDKGKAKTDTSGFVITDHLKAPTNWPSALMRGMAWQQNKRTGITEYYGAMNSGDKAIAVEIKGNRILNAKTGKELQLDFADSFIN
jgi:hypothetical protein